MDVMRTGCSMLGTLETEQSFEQQHEVADRLLAAFPAIITYWYRYTHDGVRIETQTDDDSIGAHFLHLLHGKPPNKLHEDVMHASLILYAEHEFNASTFTARSAPPRCPTCIPASPAPSARCAVRCMAAPTRRRWR